MWFCISWFQLSEKTIQIFKPLLLVLADKMTLKGKTSYSYHV